MKTKLLSLLLTLLLATSFAGAQALAPAATTPTIDGAVQKGEYTVMQAPKGFWLGVSLSQDKSTLTLGLASQTTGWIAIGLGSLKMNGSYIVIGYDKAGKQVISEDKGVGHGHSPLGTHKVLKSIIKTANGQTSIEFSIPAADYIKDGKLQLILAAANTADLISFHPKFASLEIPVAK
jgi:hypothetical protein